MEEQNSKSSMGNTQILILTEARDEPGIAPMGLRISYRSVVIRCPKKGAEPVTLKMMDCD